ncbi:MAG: GAF domain-containing sensor histidine kinase [Acidimicrobiia bacterium]|nr:GAF domain-containing sensor histidine kinase [Acidimicrobiia bacterium]
MSAKPLAGAPFPGNEEARLAELESLDILDSLPEEAYDAITLLASQICDVPIALINLIDRDRQWFKSRVGVPVSELPREHAFCGYAILEPNEMTIVRDAAEDYRFADNPLVVSAPSIRFYAAVPLVTTAGSALGTLCVIDREPRQLTDEQQAALRALSTQVMALLELRWTVDELERRHEELELTMKQKETLIATVSHEIRTPLTSIVGFIETLVDPEAVLSIDERRSLLETVGHQASDVSGLIEDLLVAAKAESGSLHVNSVDVDLGAQTAQVLEGLDSDTEVSIDCDTASCKAVGDPARIRQIIRNLLTNAFRYGGPHVYVKIRRADERCRLWVVDDGSGVEADQRESIFQEFNQVPGGQRITGSMGLGLPISRLLTEKMGGTLVYDGSGGTSSFLLDLPAAHTAEQAA